MTIPSLRAAWRTPLIVLGIGVVLCVAVFSTLLVPQPAVIVLRQANVPFTWRVCVKTGTVLAPTVQSCTVPLPHAEAVWWREKQQLPPGAASTH